MTVATASLLGRHVLIVEDEYWLAEAMAKDLAASGAVVVGPVPTVTRALDLIGHGKPIHGAVLDINLRGELVYPVAEALRALGVPFVFATGYDRSIVPDAFGDVLVCLKPIKVETVRAALFER